MISESLSLKRASKTHIAELQTWFNDSDQILMWAGPSLGFPLGKDDFREKLSELGFTSFALISNLQQKVSDSQQKENVYGFGQYQLHPPLLHLGRLAISPRHRGKGLASVLLNKLIKKGNRQGTITTVSLFVFVSNTAAYKAYLSAGFVKTANPTGKQIIEGCDYLTLNLK